MSFGDLGMKIYVVIGMDLGFDDDDVSISVIVTVT
jgi:hypothetical protein